MRNNNLVFNSEELIDILSFSPNATAVYVTEELKIAYANDKMLGFWGQDKSVIGLPLEDVLPELNSQSLIEILKKVWDTGIAYEGKDISAQRLRKGKLKTIYYDFVYNPLKNEKGEVYCILNTACDVTERNIKRLMQAKQHENNLKIEQATNEKLRKAKANLSKLNKELEARVNYKTKELTDSEATLRNMIAQAPVAIAVLKGKDLIIETANAKVLETWGKTEEVIGIPLKNAFPELKGHFLFLVLDSVYQYGEPYYGNEIRITSANEDKYANLVYQPIKNPEGETTSIMVVINVITEQVVARKRVEQAEEMLRFSIEAANVGTWFMNIKTREFVASDRFKELYGFDSGDNITYLDILARVSKGYHDKINDEFENALRTGNSYTLEHPIFDKRLNKVRWVKSMGKLYTDTADCISHFSGLMLDITEQKLDDLRKNDFIGMVSHELKTPLTTLKGYVQLLRTRAKKDNDPFVTNALSKVETQVNKMSELITSFLDVSRLESGKISLTKQHFYLDQLIKDIIDENTLTAPNHTILLQPCKPVKVYADQEKIGAVISNLLSNAIKYSPKGKNIMFNCKLVNDEVEVSLKDEGIGINQTDLSKLFNRYYRVESKHTQHISGFGIGLYLSAEIIHRHNGKIWAESEIGKGSTFYFSIQQNC